jgi:polysaccharide export outer membrane protein
MPDTDASPKLILNSVRIAIFVAIALASLRVACQQPAPAQAAAPQDGYRFVPGDGVAIRFFYDPELNDEQQIRPDGNIALQLIGEVHLGGRSIPEVTEELERRYKSEIKLPRVTLQVKTYAGQKVYVTGEVQHPGTVSLIGGQDVLSAIAEAGGFKQSGKTNFAILARKGPDGQIMARKVSLSLSGHTMERLQPFDMVIVTPRAIIRVDRFVDEYIRQVVPSNMETGFQYLYTHSASAVSVVPF